MAKPELDNLVKINQLKAEPPLRKEYDGMLKSAQRGLVRIEPSPTDGRTRLPVLTRSGSETLATAVPLWRGAHAEIESRLDQLDPDALRAALLRLSAI